jgi:hypothetical protein
MKRITYTYLLLCIILVTTLGLTCNRVPELSKMPIGPALDNKLGDSLGWGVLQLEDGRLLLLYAQDSAKKWYCAVQGEWRGYDVERKEMFVTKMPPLWANVTFSNLSCAVVSNVCLVSFDQIVADMPTCSGLILKSGKNAYVLYRDENDGAGYASMRLDIGMGRFSILMTNAVYVAATNCFRTVGGHRGRN